MEEELSRLLEAGAWETTTCSLWVSRMFLVPKDVSSNKWRVVVDLRHLNRFCRDFPIKYETLKRLRQLGAEQDYMFSFDLADGYYALGIAPECRDFFTVSVRGQLFRFAGLPMGWNASPYVFCTLMKVVVRWLRSPTLAESAKWRHGSVKRAQLRGQRWKGVRVLPYLDDFLFLASSRQEALRARDLVQRLLERLGLHRNPKKGQWEPTQVIEHLGLEILGDLFIRFQ